MNALEKYLNQPYPYYYKGRKLVEITLLLFTVGFLFNYLIEPFEVYLPELKMSYFWIAFIHSISIVLIVIPAAFIITKRNASIENWKIKNELYFILVLLLLTGILQFLWRDVIYNNPNNWSWEYFYEEIVNTLLVGTLLASTIVSVNLNIQFFKNNEQAAVLNLKLNEDTTTTITSEVTIETELKSETFILKIQDFIFAKSEGNYIEIWIKDTALTKPIVKRMKLKDLESVLTIFPDIIKTHRSYLLNKNYIQNVSGNAQGYKIALKKCSELVPVSRNYLEEFNSKMNLYSF